MLARKWTFYVKLNFMESIHQNFLNYKVIILNMNDHLKIFELIFKDMADL